MAATQKLTADQAKKLHYETLVVDALEAAPMTPEHYARLKKAGIRVVNYTTVNITSDLQTAMRYLSEFHKNIKANSDKVLLVRTTADIERAVREDKIALIIGTQNAKPVMDNAENVGILHALGVRIMQLTYNERNLLGDGCCEKANAGLSRLGYQVVREMNRYGMLIDLSHCCEQTTIDGIEASEAPVAITHSMAKALTPSPRNKNDHVLKLLASRGGVIGAAFWSPMAYRDPNKRPVMSDFFDHVDHLVQQAGIDHVGIGSDLGEGESREYYENMFARGGGIYPEVTAALGDWYDFDHRMVEGMDTSLMFPQVTEGLAARGYSDEHIRKIMGGNFMRLFKQVFDAKPENALF